MTNTLTQWCRSRWFVPAFCLVFGLLLFAAFTVGGQPWAGLASVVLTTLIAAIFLVGQRNDTIAGLGGPGRDERWEMIDLRAIAFAGTTVLITLIGVWLWRIVQGEDGSPYTELLLVGGVSYIAAILFFRRRM